MIDSMKHLTVRHIMEIMNVSYPTALSYAREYGEFLHDVPPRGLWVIPYDRMDEYVSDLENRAIAARATLDATRNDSNYRSRSTPPKRIGHGGIDTARTDEVRRLRYDQKWTLAEIGKKFGISRERVRQVLGNTGYGFKRSVEKEIAINSPDLTTAELADILEVTKSAVAAYRKGIRHKIDLASKVGVGSLWEERAAERLNSLGYATELQTHGRPFDILVNGKCRVDVKVCLKQRQSPSLSRTKNPLWGFSLRVDHADVDFYIFVIEPTEDFFVVPVAETPVAKYKPSVRFAWPTSMPTLGKYQKFHNRFDLIGEWLAAAASNNHEPTTN